MKKTYNFKRLQRIISNFKNANIMVIGDLILDEFIWGRVERISPEAPVPVVWVERESFMPGGASNVANNIASLGGKADLVGVIGDDQRGRLLRGELTKKGVVCEGVFADKTRPTTLKSRVIAHKQQVVRIDKESVNLVSEEILSKILVYVRKRIKEIDMLIIEDYGKGMITPSLLKRVIPLAKRFDKPVAVDPKEDHFSFYKGVNLITPNAEETYRATGIKIIDDETLKKAGRSLLTKLGCKTALITLGEKGMVIFKPSGEQIYIPATVQEVYDVSGAGDTVIGVFCLAKASGAKDIEAVYIANCAAGIVVSKVGIAVVSPAELLNKIKEETKR